MAKNNSPLNYDQASWAHHDAEEAKKKYAEGDTDWGHALGRDEFAADHGKWSGTSEHTGNSRWAKGAPTMWESHSQIGKHMSSNLWGEAKREEEYIPELDHGAAMPMKSSPIHQEDDVDGKNQKLVSSRGYDGSFMRPEKDKPNMKDLPLNSPERWEEYENRGWAHDETSVPKNLLSAAMPQKEKPKEQKWGGNKGEVKRSAPKDFPG